MRCVCSAILRSEETTVELSGHAEVNHQERTIEIDHDPLAASFYGLDLPA